MSNDAHENSLIHVVIDVKSGSVLKFRFSMKYKSISQQEFDNLLKPEVIFENYDLSNIVFPSSPIGAAASGQDLYVSVVFKECRVLNSKIQNVNFAWAKFINCDFSGTQFIKIEFPSDKGMLDVVFHRCKFIHCIFRGQIAYISFLEAKFIDVGFWSTTLLYVDFRKSTFRQNTEFLGITNFHSVIFYDAQLRGVDFSNFDERDEKKGDNAYFPHHHRFVHDLQLRNLAGVDLIGSKLPEYLNNFNYVIESEAEAVRNARNLFVILVPFCFYVLVIALWGNDAASKNYVLPLIGTTLGKEHFLVVASLVITGLFTYFHLYLQRMWEQLNYLPAIFPDGVPLWDKVSPWMFSTLVWQHIFRLQPRLSKKSFDSSDTQNEDISEYDLDSITEEHAIKQLMNHKPQQNYQMQKFLCVFFGWLFPIFIVSGFTAYLFYTKNNDLLANITPFWITWVCGLVISFLGLKFLRDIRKIFIH